MDFDGELAAVKWKTVDLNTEAYLFLEAEKEQSKASLFGCDTRIVVPTDAFFSEDPSDPALLHLWQVMEYVEGATLHDLSCAYDLTNPNCSFVKQLPEVIESWVVQLVALLSAIHLQGLVHRDIKGDNVLVNEEGVVHIIDLEMGMVAGQLTHFHRCCQTFAAPEVLDKGYPMMVPQTSQDFFALGVMLMHCIAPGCHPYIELQVLRREDVTDAEVATWMDQAPGIFWPAEMDADLMRHPGLKGLIAGLVERDPAQRWGLNELLLSPYLSSTVLSRVAAQHPRCAEDMARLMRLQAELEEQEGRRLASWSWSPEQVLAMQRQTCTWDAFIHPEPFCMVKVDVCEDKLMDAAAEEASSVLTSIPSLMDRMSHSSEPGLTSSERCSLTIITNHINEACIPPPPASSSAPIFLLEVEPVEVAELHFPDLPAAEVKKKSKGWMGSFFGACFGF